MDVTVFFERDAYSIDSAGRNTYKHTMIYRVETEDGIQDWSEIRMRWFPWYQKTPEINARVISSDGKVSLLDPKTITDGPAREDDEDTYVNDRIHKVPLPGIAVGSIVEEEETVTDTAPYFAEGRVYTDTYSRSVPSIRVELSIDVPASTRFRYQVHGMPNAQVKEEVQGEVRHFSLEQGYLPGQAESDIDLPTHETRGPFVVFSTGESWASIANGYRQLAEVNIDPDKVKNLVPHEAADRGEAIAQIVARLHKEVRYTGIEFGEAGLQPVSATEVLKRHYGDCKDKAAMLVAMLRSAGIPAYIALLDSGPGEDTDPELPGMGSFDHAIVYVPETQKAEALWIDATAEFATVGTLPYMDEGRLALVIKDGTTELTRTPEAAPAGDELVELRDVAMQAYGAAKITETSLSRGDVDALYRSTYGDALTRETKADLEKYAKNEYSAKALTNISHGDEHDLTKPFALKLEMAEAKAGYTAVDDSVVYIPFSDIFGRLPEWFRTDPKTKGEKLTPQQQENHTRAEQARAAEYDVEPLSTEWRYTVAVPEGFVLRALPEDKSTNIGPALFTQHYEKDNQANVKATLRFETTKPRYSSHDVLALRDAVLEAYKQDSVAVWFDQAGSKLIRNGKTREGLAADRTLIANHPTEGLYHAQIAYAYVTAGLGDLARSEAEQAIKLDPKSFIAYRSLGWACEFNEVGIQFAAGFDLDCAIKALKQAVELDPDDSSATGDLAVLNEYDQDGERYTANAHLADGVSILRALKEKDKAAGEQYENNILFDLFYSGRYKELLDELEKLPATTTRRGLEIAAVVAMKGGTEGTAAGTERANQLSAGTDERTKALATAGNMLLRLRLYPEAAEMLSAAAEGQQDSAATAQRIALLRQLTPWNGKYLPATDPCSVVQRMFIAYLTGRFDETIANEVLSRHAYSSDDEWQNNLKKSEQTRGMLHLLAGKSQLPAVVLLDVTIGNLKFSAEGDDESGYRITLNRLGAKATQYFVTKDNGAYFVVTNGTASEAGNEALYLLNAGRNKEAQSLLNWMREQMHKGGGDDPLAGPVFPRFWSVGDAADPNAMKLAASALVSSNPAIKDLLPFVRDAWQKASTDEARLNLALLLAYGYLTTEDASHLQEIASGILKEYPDSNTALNLLGSAYGMQKEWGTWKTMLDTQLAKRPDDEELIRLKALWGEESGDWPEARSAWQMLIDKGTAKPNDYNMYGWSSLFDNTVNDAAISQARQATMLTNNASFAEIHTLACLYAAEGKTTEARDLLLKAMNLSNLSIPNSEVWFGFGSIYEQYGLNDAAARAYSKVEKPLGRMNPSNTYLLAQARLKNLESRGTSKNSAGNN